MTFRIRGIEIAEIEPYVSLSDEELRAHNARRVIADKRHAYPDRVELRDAEPGERLLLLNYEHQPARSPYRASHAISCWRTLRTATIASVRSLCCCSAA